MYISSPKVKPLRAITVGYTGPTKSTYLTITSIPKLKNHIAMMDTLLGAEEKPSAFKINQFLRGELFSVVNSLLMNDIKPLEEELGILN